MRDATSYDLPSPESKALRPLLRRVYAAAPGPAAWDARAAHGDGDVTWLGKSHPRAASQKRTGPTDVLRCHGDDSGHLDAGWCVPAMAVDVSSGVHKLNWNPELPSATANATASRTGSGPTAIRCTAVHTLPAAPLNRHLSGCSGAGEGWAAGPSRRDAQRPSGDTLQPEPSAGCGAVPLGLRIVPARCE
jgi:hypothetical protein